MDGENEILIDGFLSGTLSEKEKQIFDQKMIDPGFVLEVTFYKQMKTAAIIEGRNEFKKRLEQIGLDHSNKKEPILILFNQAIRQIAYPLAASFILIVALSALYIYQSSYNQLSKFSKKGGYSSIIKTNVKVSSLNSVSWKQSILLLKQTRVKPI